MFISNHSYTKKKNTRNHATKTDKYIIYNKKNK